MNREGEQARSQETTPIADYIARVVAEAPPLSEAPVEAEQAIRALGNHSRPQERRAS